MTDRTHAPDDTSARSDSDTSARLRNDSIARLRDASGPRFGEFGGQYLPEALVHALHEITEVYEKAILAPEFTGKLARLAREYSGRPSLLSEAPRFSRLAGRARILLKRDDLNHTSSHKINNVLGHALLTVRMGKKRVIAETGAGQHGVATATAAALVRAASELRAGVAEGRA